MLGGLPEPHAAADGGSSCLGMLKSSLADPEAIAHTLRGWRENARVRVSWTALWTRCPAAVTCSASGRLSLHKWLSWSPQASPGPTWWSPPSPFSKPESCLSCQSEMRQFGGGCSLPGPSRLLVQTRVRERGKSEPRFCVHDL